MRSANPSGSFVRTRILLALSLLFTVLVGLAPQTTSAAAPTWTKTFTPDTIGPGSVSTLTFDIVNPDPVPRTDLAFTDTLPAGVVIASPANASQSCPGTFTTPDGGGTITLTDGDLAASGSCSFTVDVTSGTAATHENTTGDLTSSGGNNSGTATDTLTVSTSLPGFIKSFSPTTVDFGGRSTLTFTIDNTANAAVVPNLDFTDNLPTGMTVANPSNKATTCGTALIPAVVTAVPGSSTITLDADGFASFPAVAANATCTVSVDVIGGAVDKLVNSVELLANFVSAGKANAALTVTGFSGLLQLTKEFTDDPVAPGGTTTLEFTITNKSRDDAATGITFDDDLETTLTGLTPTLPGDPDPPCGAGSTLSFSLGGVLTLTGGSLPAEGACTFSVELSVPAGATPGTYPNTAGPVSGDVGGSPEVGNVDGDLLFVVAFPVLTKEFTVDPIGTGGTTTIEFTITNTSSASILTDIEFFDELTDGSSGSPPDPTSGFLPFPVSVGLPPVPDPPCGGSSSLSLVVIDTDREALFLDGGSLAAAGSPGDSCSFTVTVDIPDGLAAGTYTNTTEEISAVLDDLAGDPVVTGPAASDDIVIVAAPQLTKEFTDDPAIPGGTAELTFTLENLDDTNTATAVSFTDDLTFLTGLTATSVDFNDCAATVDITTDPTLIDVTGGTLASSSTCTITLTLDVPSGVGGTFTNTTSPVSATVAGLPTSNAAASDDLVVVGVLFSKAFDNPVIPGAETTLTFTLDNVGAADATGITFSDDLTAILPGPPPDVTVVPPLPDTSSCGAGSTLIEIGGTFLFFSGGAVDAGTFCSFDVTVLVPAAADDGNYFNVTSPLSYSAPGAVTGPPAAAILEVDSVLLALTKEFTDDPVFPGDTVTLDFTLENLSATETVTDIAFDDDLDATLSGLVATGANSNGCGGMAAGFPAGLFEYSDGTLLPGATCTISLNVDVPPPPVPGNAFPNTTTAVTGKVGTLDVVGDPATDTLLVDTVFFSKVFTNPIHPGTTGKLTFTIDNLDTVNGVSGIAFSDDLNDALTGLQVVAPTTPEPCGPGSSHSVGTFLTLSNGSVPAGGACVFEVNVEVPSGAASGDYLNTTSQLFSSGVPVADPATDTLTVEPPPAFAKSFAPNPIVRTTNSTLTFTIDNTAGTVAASSVDFTDNLPAGVEVATPPNAATDCTGGTLTAVAGTSTITYTGGEVGAVASCTIDVDVTGTADGSHVNLTGDLTSTSGNSGTATDTLTVDAPTPPTFTKAFAPDTIVEGDVSTLTFTIDNTASTIAATSLDFTDNLPAGVEVATPPNAATDCTGGTLTAVAGTSTITYSGGEVGAGATCTIDVDVTSLVADVHDNLSGDLTSTSDNSGPASATLTVTAIPPVFSKEFIPDTIVEGNVSALTFTIDNTASANDATGLDFTDTLPTDVVIATPSNKAKTCTDGMVDAPDGGDTISYGGGEVGAGETCTVTVDVTSLIAGDHDNLTGDLTSTSGNSGTAADTITVTAIPPGFAKTFLPDTITEGDNSTLRFAINNSASANAATNLDFTDNLPAGVEVATPADNSTDCIGGTITAVAGTSTISYSGGTAVAGEACTVNVEVTGTTPGSHVNLSGELTSDSGNSGTATDTLTVEPGQPFTTVTGRRYADTRLGGTTFDGLFQGAGPRTAGSNYEVTIAGRGGVPANAIGAIINVTSVGSSPPPGFFTVFDCGTLPTASALNYVAGVDVANEIFAKLSQFGSVCVYTFSQTNLLIDVVGYVLPDDTVKLLDAARLAESREGAPTIDGVMAGFGRTTAGSTTTVQITGRAGVPADIHAAIVNVAAVDPTADSFLTVFPCGALPTASSINYTNGVNRANELIAEVNVDGEICVYTDTDIDFIVDVVGYVEVGSALVSNGPSRFTDTRPGATTIDGLNEGDGPLAPGSTYEIQISGRDGVPADAVTVVANVAAVDPAAAGFFTVTACVAPTPNASSLNYTTGVNGANELVVPLSATGKICVFTSAETDLLVDVVGYVENPAA